MSTLYECDWCGETFEDRDQVAAADVTIGTTAEKLHCCADCAPDFLKPKFPGYGEASDDDVKRAVTDGGRPATVGESRPPTLAERIERAAHSEETPLPGQDRCKCDRLLSPRWDYCPSCGRKQGGEA